MTKRDEFTAFFRQVQIQFSRFFAHILTQVDLTLPQYALLSQLVASGIVPMTHASKKLHVSKPAITNLVDRLEKKKFLKRLPHHRDRRIYLLQVQSKGEKIVRTIQAQALHLLFKTLTQFSGQERETIVQFYASLSKTISKALDEPGKI